MQKTHTPLDDYGTAPLPSTDLNLIYTDFMNQLKLSKKHYAKLKSDGWPDKLIKDSFIRSLYLSKKYDTEKGFYSDHEERHMICQLLLKNTKP